MALVLVKLDQHVGGGLVVEQQHHEQGLLVIQVAHQLGDVGGVQVLDLLAHLFLGFLVDEVIQVMDIFFGKLFHFLQSSMVNQFLTSNLLPD